MKRNLCTFLVLLLLFTQAAPVFATESTPPKEPDTTLDSGAGKPSDGEEISLIPLVPATPTDAEEAPLIPLEPSTFVEGEPLPETDSGLDAQPIEITRLFRKELLLRANVLTSGDTEAFQKLQERITDTVSILSGVSEDAEYYTDVETEKITWDAVDINTPGEYTVTLFLQLTEEYRDAFYMSDETRTLTFPVMVASAQTLGLVVLEITAKTILLLITPEQTASPNLWYAEVSHGELPDATAWRLDETGEIGYTSFSHVTLQRDRLTQNMDYHIRIEQDGLVSESYVLDCAVIAADTDLDDGSGGDRDGNDTDDGTVDPPDLEQSPPPPPPTDTDDDQPGNDDGGRPTPPPTAPPADKEPEQPPPPSKPQEPSPPVEPTPTPPGSGEENAPEIGGDATPPPAKEPDASIPVIGKAEPERSAAPTAPQEKPKEPEPPREIVTHDSLTISGARLAWMLRGGGNTVPFGWNGISIELPAAFIEGLSLESEEMLSLTMVKDSDDGFTITILADDVPLANLPPTTVRFSIAKQKTAPVLLLDEHRLDTLVRYENGCAVFSIAHAGSYRLTEGTPATIEPIPVQTQPPPETVSAVPQPAKLTVVDFLPITVAGFLCAAAAFLFIRRKRR